MADGTLDIRSKRKGRVGVKGVDEFLAESIDEIRRKTYL
jgi:hypothetical protein